MNEAKGRLLSNSLPIGGGDIFGCLVWQEKPRNGYGRISVGGVVHSVHRLAYEEWIGEIPHGYHVHHRCGNKLCIRVSHLEIVTPRDHVLVRHPEILAPAIATAQRAAAEKNRAKTHCVHGHPLDDAWVRSTGHRQCRMCNRERQRERRTRLAHA